MSESNGQPDLRVFSTGAVRTRDADGERYDLFSPIGMERLARIYAEGANRPEYGPMSWERGMPISDIMNHGLRHWRLYASGDRSEDHLAKLAWAAFAAMHSEVMWPHLNTDLRREGCIPPTVDDATAASWKTLAENLRRMKEGVKAAAAKEEDPWAGRGAYMDGTGTIRFAAQDPDLFSNGAKADSVDDGVGPLYDGIEIDGLPDGTILDIDGTIVGHDAETFDSFPHRELFVMANGRARILKSSMAAPFSGLDRADQDRILAAVLAPPPRKYHILADPDHAGRAAQYRTDLEFEGHEVVSRWIDNAFDAYDDQVDLHSCDAAIVLLDGVDGKSRLDRARRSGKPTVAIGPQPKDFPAHGTADRWFPTWHSFLSHLAAARVHAPVAR